MSTEDLVIAKQKPLGIYCEQISMFSESKICPFLDERYGARRPFCIKLKKYLGWDIAGHILKECE